MATRWLFGDQLGPHFLDDTDSEMLLIESIAQGPDARRTYYCPKCQGDKAEGR